MSYTKNIGFGGSIGFIIGFITSYYSQLDGNIGIYFFHGLIFATIAVFFQISYQAYTSIVKNDKHSFFANEERFMNSILKLAAAITKIDDEISESEKELIKQKLTEGFNPEKAEHFMKLYETYLSRTINITEEANTIDYQFDDSAKQHLIYLLVGIAVADGVLKESEIDLLKKITIRANIKIGVLISAFKVFEYKRESINEKKRNRNQEQPKRRTSSSQLTIAYDLLGISKNASTNEIKKAYRTLAKQHHPDKVSHLGEAIQVKAKERFQIIAEAYELIQKSKS